MQPPVHHEITIEGILDPRWPTRFDALQLTSDAAGRTTITGPVADQTALHGLLARLRDLGLPPARSVPHRPQRPVTHEIAQ